MLVSAELRWFWAERPEALQRWFHDAQVHGCAPGGGGTRNDRYLRQPQQPELGFKERGGGTGVEIKGLVARAQPVAAGPFQGTPERWAKWNSPALSLDGFEQVEVEKNRWLRAFDCAGDTPRELALGADDTPLQGAAPKRGCHLEFTELTLGGERWWTLGFEAYGPLDTVESDLRRVIALLADRAPPALTGAMTASYPQWLVDRAG